MHILKQIIRDALRIKPRYVTKAAVLLTLSH